MDLSHPPLVHPPDERLSLLALHVDADALLVPVDGQEVGALADTGCFVGLEEGRAPTSARCVDVNNCKCIIIQSDNYGQKQALLTLDYESHFRNSKLQVNKSYFQTRIVTPAFIFICRVNSRDRISENPFCLAVYRRHRRDARA